MNELYTEVYTMNGNGHFGLDFAAKSAGKAEPISIMR
jgi:hypothetical protein